MIDRAYGGIIFRKTYKGSKILVLKKKKYKSWDLPKGHPEKGETVKETILREIQEECGYRKIKLSNQKVKVKYYVNEKSGSFPKEVIFYIGYLLDKGEVPKPNPTEKEDITETRWVTIDEAKKLLTFPPFKETLRKAVALV